jgi:hypothetical protein
LKFRSGCLGDRFGWRFTYQANLALFGLSSLADAFAPKHGRSDRAAFPDVRLSV